MEVRGRRAAAPNGEPGVEWLARLGERGCCPPSPVRTASRLAGPLVGLPPKNPLFTGEPYTVHGTELSGAYGFTADIPLFVLPLVSCH